MNDKKGKKKEKKKKQQPAPQTPEQKFPIKCQTCAVLVDEDTYCGETIFGYKNCANKYRQAWFF